MVSIDFAPRLHFQGESFKEKQCSSFERELGDGECYRVSMVVFGVLDLDGRDEGAFFDFGFAKGTADLLEGHMSTEVA